MKVFTSSVFVWVFLCVISLPAQNAFLEVRPAVGDGTITLMQKFELSSYDCNYDLFFEMNRIDESTALMRHQKYKLPIQVVEYDGKSIRSTIGKNDWDLATKIASFNRQMNEKQLKQEKYQNDGKLWVPMHLMECADEKPKTKLASSGKMVHFPAFGEKHANFEMIDQSLAGKVFYLVSGHGGPDPGAMCKTDQATLCEDEYAYDVVLRLAKNLMARGADVEVIIQDPNDGIRSEPYLDCDNDEICSGGSRLPLNQLKRLQQRTAVINDLYVKNRKEGAKEQIAIMIHVDSRSVNKNQDVFFYHLADSRNGKTMAKKLYKTFKDKYAVYRASGQYHGSVSSRNLYMLRATYPPAVFIELGNLRNPHDQQRIILETNRQALADWIYEGLAGA